MKTLGINANNLFLLVWIMEGRVCVCVVLPVFENSVKNFEIEIEIENRKKKKKLEFKKTTIIEQAIVCI
jgi:hypothetical protein